MRVLNKVLLYTGFAAIANPIKRKAACDIYNLYMTFPLYINYYRSTKARQHHHQQRAGWLVYARMRWVIGGPVLPWYCVSI